MTRAALADVPGTLVNRPWVDFAANRSEALELARPHGHYALIIDADDGEITRTRKIRRNVVEERYKPIIDAIYDRRETVLVKARIGYETGEVGVIERTLSVQEA